MKVLPNYHPESIDQVPMISIIMPSYNHASYIRQSIESVINQEYSNWELLIIDNYSTDETDYVLQGFSNEKIKITKINNGGSIAVSRNVGVRQAKGEWVAFLDSDDLWATDKLLVCSGFFSRDVDFIYHDMSIFYNNHKKNSGVIKSRQVRHPVLNDLLLNGNTIATSSVIVRKSHLFQIDGMNESLAMKGTSDFNTWLKIARITEHFKHVPYNLGSYRRHDQNVSEIDNFILPREAIEEFLHLLSVRERSHLECHFNYVRGRLKYKSGKYSECRTDLLKVVIARGRFVEFIKSMWMIFMSYAILFAKRLIK